MGKKSSQKGARAEREAIKLLEKYWGGKFRRSGRGFAGGDVVDMPDDFPWVVEIKHRKDIKTVNFFYPNAALDSCVCQAAEQAGNLPWLLLIKCDGHWFAMTDHYDEYSDYLDTDDTVCFNPTYSFGGVRIFRLEDLETIKQRRNEKS